MQIYGQTDIGCIRNENQDCFTIENGKSYSLAVLCDGMGGQNSGKEAAERTCTIIMERFQSAYTASYSLNSVRNLLLSCINIANSHIYSEAQRDYKKRGMGTTCVAAFVLNNTIQLVNVGDSRAYYISSAGINPITKDHNVAQMLLDNGEITESEAISHPKRNYLTRAVGAERQIKPDYYELPFSPGDVVLLCSDGLTKYLTNDEIFQFLKQTPINLLPDKLISVANERGGKDNTTVVILWNY